MDKDVCTRGKSCKTTCIKKGLTCRESLNPNIQIDLPKAVGLLAGVLKQKIGIGAPNDPVSQNAQYAEKILGKYNKELSEEVRRGDKRAAINKRLNEIDALFESKSPNKMSPKLAGAYRTEYRKLLDQLDAQDNKMSSIMEKIRGDMMKNPPPQREIDKAMAGLEFYGNGPKGSITDKALERDVKNQVSEFMKMFGTTGFSPDKGLNTDSVAPLTLVDVYKDRRGYAKVNEGVMLTDGSKRVTFHEMGHFVELHRPWLNNLATYWRNKKAEVGVDQGEGYVLGPGNEKKYLYSYNKELSKWYKEGEVGLRGKYINPYMGKVYGKENPSTEVISMSIESFSDPKSMSRLYRAHPELFKIIVGLSGQK